MIALTGGKPGRFFRALSPMSGTPAGIRARSSNPSKRPASKDRFALSRGHYHWQHEPCWYAVRGTAGTNWSGDRKQSTLWSIKSRVDDGHGHGTQQPEAG